MCIKICSTCITPQNWAKIDQKWAQKSQKRQFVSVFGRNSKFQVLKRMAFFYSDQITYSDNPKNVNFGQFLAEIRNFKCSNILEISCKYTSECFFPAQRWNTTRKCHFSPINMANIRNKPGLGQFSGDNLPKHGWVEL